MEQEGHEKEIGRAGMPSKWDLNRIIITNKGLEVSKDIKKELEASGYKDSYHQEQSPYSKHSLNPANPNLPQGYTAQLQAQMTVSIMNKPYRTAFQIGQGVVGSPLLNNQQTPIMSVNTFSQQQIGGTTVLTPFRKDQGGLQQINADKMASLMEIIPSHKIRTHESASSKKGQQSHSSTFYAVNNRKMLEKQISVQSLGGLKLNLANFNFQNEITNQNILQKQHIQQVQQERLAKKYNEWNEQYLKSNELMKTKYYQKYEDINKLGDKEQEDNFWKQWHYVKQQCETCTKNSQQQNLRYEERIVRKLNKKYKEAFKYLPQCAKIPASTQLPLINKTQTKV